MKRVLFVSDDWEDIRVGAVKAQHRLAEALEAQGFECELLFHRHLGERPQRERWRLALSPWLAWRAVNRAWRERGPFDVIDAVGAEGFALGLLRRFSPYRRARLVVRSHGLDHLYFAGLVADHQAGLLRKPWYRRWFFPLTRLSQEAGALRFADAVIVLNRREENLIVARGWQSPPAVHRIAHGVLRQRWAEAPPPDAPRGAGVLFSGTWHTGKGIHYLAAAHRLLLARGLRIPLTLLSGMEEDAATSQLETEIIRQTFAPESRPWLTIASRFSDQDKNFSFYHRHDLLVVPSSTEAFGLVVLEALSQRLPVICTREMGAAEHLRHGAEAWLVPPRNARALADALERLWTNPALRRQIAEAGYQAAYRMTWARAANATAAAYASLLIPDPAR